ncbi:Glycerophosphodiester phosphodiesterase [Acaryochloris thomasi RCC1774]|uniref:Glycerophosphodiester phosphodiesterase n=1 Tax=Acaryochloris thomasi RCC1774 TaxID=1764569 RepID=A0A2W1J8I9_9CYAN|nr:glycerophosphodiester phosphodiesterase family protein [Acaryochloris thomasi]PZD70699.1 Glycerophosphodiester phosphodiesterase [Acaryochloris thomasi RCC1774]
MLCIGHRGAMGHAPENTIASIQKALELGADCIEVDVYIVEGHLMVFHDQRLERTTNGSGFIWDHTFDYLRTLDAGNGEQIPTLTEACQTIQNRAGLNVELKGPGTAVPVVEFITAQVKQGWSKKLFLVSSFDHQALVKVKRLDPDLQIGVLTREPLQEGSRFATHLGAYAIHPAAKKIDRQWVDEAYAQGLKIFAYTVNHPQQIHRMKALGVEGLFTNFPERVVAERREKNNIGWP